jgi:alpha-D-ribose 1-methylphosphonate 5-triphosphate synthase subunit PhnI
MDAVLDGGFSDAPRDAAHAFRAAMNAMARPGRIERLSGARPPAPLSVAAGTLILTPLHLAGGMTRPRCAAGSPSTPARPWLAGQRPPLPWGSGRRCCRCPATGSATAEYPDRSATLIVEMAALAAEGATLTGPGIRHGAAFPARDRGVPAATPACSRWGSTSSSPAATAGRPAPHHPRGGGLMYVAVKGGERAIENAHAWLAEERRGDPAVPELTVAQIREQMALAVNRVMAEGSLYDPDLAALAIKQARGDLIEAVFLIRAYRTTLPRFGSSRPVDTAAMACDRRIGDVQGRAGRAGAGADLRLHAPPAGFRAGRGGRGAGPAPQGPRAMGAVPHITGFLDREGLIETGPPGRRDPPDLTREPLELPANRALRLQALTRGDEGFVLASPIPRSAAMGAPMPLSASCASGRGGRDGHPRTGLCHRDRRGRTDRMRDGEPVRRARRPSRRNSPAATACVRQTERKAISMSLVDRACAGRNWARTTWAPRRRTRNSC